MALQEDLKEDGVKIKILVNSTHFYFHNFYTCFPSVKMHTVPFVLMPPLIPIFWQTSLQFV